MKEALVTGAAGFIGSHLCSRLLADGWTVTGIDNFDPFYPAAIKEENIAALKPQDRFRLIVSDIRDREYLSAVLTSSFDVVFHLAAKAGVRPSIDAPLEYMEVNMLGTQNLLELARQRRWPKFVFASSSSVYGVNPRVPWREDDSGLLPISPYAATKLSAEATGHVYNHLYGIGFIALRLFTVYGPGQRPDLAIHKFARLLLDGQSIPIFGDGSTSRDYTYVSDIVEGVVAAAELDRSFEIINLGNNHGVGLCEMVEQIGQALGVRPKLHYLPHQPGDVPHTRADISKARRLLAYEPKTSFRTGIHSFAKWLTAERVSVASAAVV